MLTANLKDKLVFADMQPLYNTYTCPLCKQVCTPTRTSTYLMKIPYDGFIPHFSHDPSNPKKCEREPKSKEHRILRKTIYDDLIKAGHKAAVEIQIGKCITDVYAKIYDKYFAFIIQTEMTTDYFIKKRMEQYKLTHPNKDISVIWIIPNNKYKPFQNGLYKSAGNIVWMLDIQAKHGGTIFTYEGNLYLKPIRLTTVERNIKSKEWVDNEGKTRNSIGYSTIYKNQLDVSIAPFNLRVTELVQKPITNIKGEVTAITNFIPYRDRWFDSLETNGGHV